jgi:hypothetical protein
MWFKSALEWVEGRRKQREQPRMELDRSGIIETSSAWGFCPTSKKIYCGDVYFLYSTMRGGGDAVRTDRSDDRFVGVSPTAGAPGA